MIEDANQFKRPGISGDFEAGGVNEIPRCPMTEFGPLAPIARIENGFRRSRRLVDQAKRDCRRRTGRLYRGIEHLADTDGPNGESKERVVPIFRLPLHDIAIEQREDKPEVRVSTDHRVGGEGTRAENVPENFRLAQHRTGSRVGGEVEAEQLLVPFERLDVVDRVVFGSISRWDQCRSRAELADAQPIQPIHLGAPLILRAILRLNPRYPFERREARITRQRAFREAKEFPAIHSARCRDESGDGVHHLGVLPDSVTQAAGIACRLDLESSSLEAEEVIADREETTDRNRHAAGEHDGTRYEIAPHAASTGE